MLAVGWASAGTGIYFKLWWPLPSRWLTIGLYIGTGALVVPLLPELVERFPPGGLTLLVAGGALYVIGALMYAMRWPDLHPSFGHHDLFHVVVIVASTLHYIFLAGYVLPAGG